ncbi:hypothetical protein [Streptomyces tanashiensis]|nr:hypothetical protein [Streptomyces tanashiensis]
MRRRAMTVKALESGLDGQEVQAFRTLSVSGLLAELRQLRELS